MPPTVEHKLTTVLCADVEGYSRLMDRDEIGTLEILKRHRDALAGLIERHRGRVVNTWGDSLIAEPVPAFRVKLDPRGRAGSVQLVASPLTQNGASAGNA